MQRYLRWQLGMEGEQEQQQKRRAERKRKAEKPAEAGTLRSGRRRAGCDQGGDIASRARRETRASAAAAAAAITGGDATAAPAPQGKRGAAASRTGRRR